MSDIKNANFIITMVDGSKWSVPVRIIAENRAEFFSSEFQGDIQKSLDEDTWPIFTEETAIEDWLFNNMDWKDVKDHATKIQEPHGIDYEARWLDAEGELEDEQSDF